ncbi:hypothetical protein [Microbacterium sp.]|uniref:hypothetical protein n=1 Tax=Microbacterium sp. TaxID=51671 RepID=UPI003A888AE2
MVTRVSARQQRLLRQFGANIQRWRKLNKVTANDLAQQAFVSRKTLREIEADTGTSMMAVLGALGIADTVVSAANPYNSEIGRLRMDAIVKAGGDV